MQNRYSMKQVFACTLLILFLQRSEIKDEARCAAASPLSIPPTENCIIVTIDGFRWQEVFAGADPRILGNSNYVADTALSKLLFDGSTGEERRKKLLPFFWNVVAAKGNLYGNRNYNNNVNVANLYALSYPGYNEIFTGTTDITIATNDKKNNSNRNVLEYLAAQPGLQNKVVGFTSWSVFPYILNTDRSHLLLNSGYNAANAATNALVYAVQEKMVMEKEPTRHDALTFVSAMEYMQQQKPRVVFIGFGETDEMAHQSKYDLYLQKAADCDRMLAQLWNWVQSTPGYKDNTTLIITTDHGRGQSASRWPAHGMFIKGSSQTWLALIGPRIPAGGEIKQQGQLYQKQLAAAIARTMNMNFTAP